MSPKIVWLAALIFILLVVGMFTFTYLQKKQLQIVPPPIPTATSTETTDYGIVRIDGKHFFSNGIHTIVGELTMPTPCDLLTTETLVAESYPEQVTFAFMVTNTTDMCAQAQTVQRFKAEAIASKQATLQATFMGQSVELNLVEAAPGETPAEFELYIKG